MLQVAGWTRWLWQLPARSDPEAEYLSPVSLESPSPCSRRAPIEPLFSTTFKCELNSRLGLFSWTTISERKFSLRVSSRCQCYIILGRRFSGCLWRGWNIGRSKKAACIRCCTLIDTLLVSGQRLGAYLDRRTGFVVHKLIAGWLATVFLFNPEYTQYELNAFTLRD